MNYELITNKIIFFLCQRHYVLHGVQICLSVCLLSNSRENYFRSSWKFYQKCIL